MLDHSNDMPKTVQSECRDGVLRLTLALPQKRNPLSQKNIAALTEAIAKAASDPETRVVVIDHEGPVFSSGHDLREVTEARQSPDGGKSFFVKLMAECSDMMLAIVHSPKPVIAMVDGFATAAGCQLVASCDLAYASNQSGFSTPGVNIGLFCSTPMVALSRNVLRKQAMEMLLTGEPVSAEKAVSIGLINESVPADELENRVLAVAQKIASNSGAVVKIGKQAFYQQVEMTLEDAYAYASQVMVENLDYADAKEGIGAFLEKRKPEWQDK